MNILPDDESECIAFIHLLKNKLGDSYIEQIHGRYTADTSRLDLLRSQKKKTSLKRTTTDSTRQSCSSPSLTVCQSRKPRLPTCSETLATSKRGSTKRWDSSTSCRHTSTSTKEWSSTSMRHARDQCSSSEKRSDLHTDERQALWESKT